MKPLLLVVFAFSLLSCRGTLSEIPLKISARHITESAPAPGIDSLRYQVLTVKTDSEGRSLVANRRQFLLSLLTQSYDPYFGIPQYSEDCLARNQVHDIQTQSDREFFKARLTVDDAGNPGECGQRARVSMTQVTFCRKELLLVETHIQGKNADRADPVCESPPKIRIE